ncbi:MAG TPA: VCBS repeat-containing protein [Candidatus Polarisedimenticolaceae bacterium]|nr:VCBS repeat-containing protein [Candidatus Polarisedimenticolaceae bacterium]
MLLIAACALSGAVQAQTLTFTDRLVSTEAPQADGVAAGDVDGDGDVDVVTGEYGISSIAWYENDGASPPAWTKRIVGAANGAVNVAVADADGDGDGDVFSANLNDEGINFYENLGGAPPSWVRRVLSFDGGAWGVDAADVDGDGDVDGIGGLMNTSCGPPLCVGVEWYENDGARPPRFTRHPVSPGFVGALSVRGADVDGDGDTDILSVDNGNNRVLWYENDGAVPPAWTAHVLTNAIDPWGVFSADLDRDGDTDVLTASIGDDRLVWYENDGAGPPHWTPHPLPSTTDGPTSVTAADLDGDGDVDVASGADDTTIAWYESDGKVAPLFVEHRIGSCVSPLAIDAARVDADADVDLLCASNFVPGRVHLFANDANFLDSDGDGVRDDLDCAPNDATRFAVPGEVRGVRFTTPSSLAWAPAGLLGGPATVHDVLRGLPARLPVGTGPGEGCLVQAAPGAALTVGEVPSAGTGFYYLVRGRNGCGVGSYGSATSGEERTSAACP